MQVEYAKALEIYNRFPENMHAPSFHPCYIAADARRDCTLIPVFFVYEDKEGIYYHGFHMSPVKGTEFFDIQSPYGYGGPIASCLSTSFLAKAWYEFSNWCEENNILAEFIRFHPLIKNWRYFNGDLMEDRKTVWIDLKVDEILMTYGTRARTAVRKALKSGLSVEWVDGNLFIEEFRELYNATMSQLNADEFYYYKNDYYTELFNWDYSNLALCRLQGEAVAAAIFLVGPEMVEYHLSASTLQGKKFCATNLLIHEAALLGQRRGCGALHLGGGIDGSPENPLLFFKSGFSGLKAVFMIGKKIHRIDAYDAMKKEWLEKNGEVANKVLFYRF